jgi:LuxR family maltose regulon positive regulatory protein
MSYFVPRRPQQVVTRGRITELFAAADSVPLLVVRAPAGFGKTVAIVDWLATVRESTTETVWVTLTADAHSRRQFWTRIVAALFDANLIPDSGLLSKLVLLGESLRDTEILPALGRGFAEIRSSVRIVVDDFHLVTSAVVANDLLWLLAETPGLSAVIATRTRSELESVASESALGTVVITRDDLEFSRDETFRVAAETIGELGSTQADQLHTAAAGWPLATRVLMRFLTSRSTEAVPSAAAPGNDFPAVERHLAELAISDRDVRTVQFMLLTSIAEVLSITTARELSGRTDDEVGEILDSLADDGFGQWQESDGALIFRYHPLLRSGFENLLAVRLPSEAVAVRERLARSLRATGDIVGAVEQCAVVENWDLLAEIYLSSPSTMFNEAERLLVVLQAIPRSVQRKYPLLLVALIICTYAYRLDSRDRLLTGFDTALVLAQGKLADKTTTEGLFWSTAVMAANRLTGRTSQALKSAAVILPAETSALPSHAAELLANHPFVYNQVGITFLYTNQFDRALTAFANARDVPPTRPDAADASHSIALSAGANALRGRMDVAAGLMATAAAIERPHGWLGSYFGAGYQIAAMYDDLERFDDVPAERRLRAIDEDMASNIEHWPYLVHIEGLIALTRGGGREGVLAFTTERDNIRKRPRTSPQLHALLAATEADLLMTAGQLPQAAAVLKKWRGHNHWQPELSAARLAILRARPEEALTILESLGWAELERVRAEAALLSAVAILDLDNGATTRQAVADSASTAVELMNQFGLARPLMMIPRARLQPALATVLGIEDAAALLARVPDPFGRLHQVAQLTRRELVVLRELVTTSESLEIAERLSVSRHTIKVQLKSTWW